MDNFEQNQGNNSASSPGSQSNQQAGATSFADEFKSFYKGDFKSIMTLFFTSPIDGIRSIFVNLSDRAYTSALILFVSVFSVYFAGSYIMIPEKLRDYLDLDLVFFMKIGLLFVIFMLLITIFTFGIKSGSGKPVFKTELLTGGLCGVPLGILCIALLVLRFMGEEKVMELVDSPVEAGTVFLVFLLYIFLMLINVVQQSLKASGTKDSLAWYGSTLVVLLSFYFTYKVVWDMLF